MPEENPNLNNSNNPNSQTVPEASTTPDASTPQTTPTEPTNNSTAPESTSTAPSEPTIPETPSASAPSETPTAPDTAPAPMTSPIMKSKINKPKNKLLPVVLILSVLTLAGIGTSVFFGIQNSDKDSEIVRLKNQLSSQTPTTPDEPTDNPDDGPETPDDPEEITSEIRNKVLASVPSSLVLDNKKPLNTSYDMSYSISGDLWADRNTDEQAAFVANLNLTDNTTTLTINWDQAKKIYPFLDASKTGTENISNLGLSGKPTDLLLTGFGQTAGYGALFFLMEDGTIEYIPLAKAAKDNNFKSYGKLPNISNVIKFYRGASCDKSGPGCGQQSLAQRADGNFYELYDAVNATGNFDI